MHRRNLPRGKKAGHLALGRVRSLRFEPLERRFLLATFTVTDNGDTHDIAPGDGACVGLLLGPCTLRAAIEEANALPGPDTIIFPPLIAPTTPTLGTPLTITSSVLITGGGTLMGGGPVDYPGLVVDAGGATIDGITFTGFAGAGIHLTNGIGSVVTNASLIANVVGIQILRPSSDNTIGPSNHVLMNIDDGILIGDLPGGAGLGGLRNTIVSNTITANGGNGIRLNNMAAENRIIGGMGAPPQIISANMWAGVLITGVGTNRNTVEGNLIGTDDGIEDMGNGMQGVLINDGAAFNVVRGTLQRPQVISGNDETGVEISGPDTDNNIVEGNFIGANVNGTGALSNSMDGVRISGGAEFNFVRGTSETPQVISGNDESGVALLNADNNIVEGNLIGTNVLGTQELGNGAQGVIIAVGVANAVRGTSDAPQVISGNLGTGVEILLANNNSVRGNLIGTQKDGMSALGNAGAGIFLGSGAMGNNIGPENRIAFNTLDGVVVAGGALASIANRITENSIFMNSSLGIDLTPGGGANLNDPLDADAGANNLQNFPEFAFAPTLTSDEIVVRYSVPSHPANADYPLTVEFFADDGSGQGRTFLGTDTYTAADSANSQLAIPRSAEMRLPAAGVAPGAGIVATATDAMGNTSEFSAPAAVLFEDNRGPQVDNVFTTTTAGEYVDLFAGKPETLGPHQLVTALSIAFVDEPVRAMPGMDAGQTNAYTLMPDTGTAFAADQIGPVGGAMPGPVCTDAICQTTIARANHGVLTPAGGPTQQVPIGFSFPFFEANYSTIFVSQNGMLTFGDAPPAEAPPAGPLSLLTAGALPPPAIVPYGATLPGAGQVFYRTLGIPGGTQRLVVQWNYPTDVFQAVLFENGNIEFRYNMLTTPTMLYGIRNSEAQTMANGDVRDYTGVAPPAPGTVRSDLFALQLASADPAVFPQVAGNAGHYRLVGDNSGEIQIVGAALAPAPPGPYPPTLVTLTLGAPLADDRYTLIVSDSITDPAGNRLDGESTARAPGGAVFPSGDGVPGGDFVARFTIDSRPEIGVWASGTVAIDTNGNFRFDPDNTDAANRDIVYNLGSPSDYIFAGNFVTNPGPDGMWGNADDGEGPPGTPVLGPPDPDDLPADGFAKLAVYGRVGGQWVFRIDTDNNGVPDETATQAVGFAGNGFPVAGNFDVNADNGDEVGIFTGTAWILDGFGGSGVRNFMLNAVDEAFMTPMRGYPFVGDFDGNGDIDFGTYNNSTGMFQISDVPGGSSPTTFSFEFPFPGVRQRPIAADMNGDGFTDIGLWVPDQSAVTPREAGEWYFLISNGAPVTNRIVNGVIPFTPAPFGSDLYAQFGDDFAQPIVGNFDPPITASGGGVPPPNAAPLAANMALSITNQETAVLQVLEAVTDVDSIELTLISVSTPQGGAVSFTSGGIVEYTPHDGFAGVEDLTYVVADDHGNAATGWIRINVQPPSPLAGDYNLDGIVDQADLDLVLVNWGRSAAAAPSEWIGSPASGNIDQDELDAVLTNWGATTAAQTHGPPASLTEGRLQPGKSPLRDAVAKKSHSAAVGKALFARPLDDVLFTGQSDWLPLLTTKGR